MLVGQYTRSYLVMVYQDIELHFYGTKRIAPNENASVCFISVDDVDRLHDDFVENIGKATGKVPRSGFPKITKVRDLSKDRRFTLTDPSGNTFYIGTRKPAQSNTFFRELADEQYAAQFKVLYDLVYSKEDCEVAHNCCQSCLPSKNSLGIWTRQN